MQGNWTPYNAVKNMTYDLSILPVYLCDAVILQCDIVLLPINITYLTSQQQNVKWPQDCCWSTIKLQLTNQQGLPLVVSLRYFFVFSDTSSER